METIKLVRGDSGTNDRSYSGRPFSRLDIDDTTTVETENVSFRKIYDETITLQTISGTMPVPVSEYFFLHDSEVTQADANTKLFRYRVRIVSEHEFTGTLLLWLAQYNAHLTTGTYISDLSPVAPYTGANSYVGDDLGTLLYTEHADADALLCNYAIAEQGKLLHNNYPKGIRELKATSQPKLAVFPTAGYMPRYKNVDVQFATLDGENLNEVWIDTFNCEFYDFEFIAKGFELVVYAPFNGRIEVWKDSRNVTMTED